MRINGLAIFFCLGTALAAPACSDDDNHHADPCEGVACSGHGTCVATGDQAQCDCDSGYHAEGLACVEDTTDPCQGVNCSGHGTCVETGGQAECDCDDGYHAEGLECVEDVTYTPLPVRDACAAPTVTNGASLAVSAGNLVGSVHLTWTGAEAAVAYADSIDPMNNICHVVVQRLGQDGQAVGSPETLATDVGCRVALTTDRQRYYACWTDTANAEISCATLPLTAGAATAGLTVAGSAPSLTYGAGGVVLAYSTSSGVQAQKLDTGGGALGTPATLSGEEVIYTAIAPTLGGYVVGAGGYSFAHNVTAYPLDATLAATGNPAELLPNPGAKSLSLAGSGDSVAAIVVDSSQVSGFTISADGTATGGVRLDDPTAQIPYGPVGAAGGTSSFALFWSAFEGTINYRVLDTTGNTQGDIVSVADTMWDDNPLATVAVADGFLLAVSLGVGVTPELAIYHLACP